MGRLVAAGRMAEALGFLQRVLARDATGLHCPTPPPPSPRSSGPHTEQLAHSRTRLIAAAHPAMLPALPLPMQRHLAEQLALAHLYALCCAPTDDGRVCTLSPRPPHAYSARSSHNS